jgi:hypothetical protein
MTHELEPRISVDRRTVEQLGHELTSARSCCADNGHTSETLHRREVQHIQATADFARAARIRARWWPIGSDRYAFAAAL